MKGVSIQKRLRLSVCALATILLVVSAAQGATRHRGRRSTPRVAGGVRSAVPSSAANVAPPGLAVAISAGVSETTRAIMEREARAPRMPSPVVPRPELQYPDRQNLPSNPDSPPAATFAPARGAQQATAVSASQLRAGPLVAQTLGPSFTAATLFGINATSAFPPDSMGAVGPAQYVVAVNNRLVSFTKSGVEDGVLNTTTDTFFSSVRNGSGTSDPRIRYDRLTGRWFVVMITVTNPNRVMIAWSDAASGGIITKTTVWTFVFFNETAGASCIEDYPTLGIDTNALYIGTNSFCGPANAENFTGTSGYIVPKASLLAGTGSVTRFALVPTSTAAGPYTPQGVDNYDPTSTEGYFIGVDNATFGTLMLRRVQTPGSVPTISGNIAITIPSTTFPKLIPHLGNTGGVNGQLDSLDDRLYAAHIRNGRLWTAHNITVTAAGVATSTAPPTGRVGVRWYELNGIRSTDNSGVPVVVQAGTFFDSATDGTTARNFWIPSIMISGQQHAALGFSTAGTNFHVDAGTAGRLSGDVLSALQPFSLFTSTSSAYNPPSDPGGQSGRRWGDYSYTSVDPLDDMTMWTVQEFCDTTNSYGVRVQKLIAPPPASPAAVSPTSINTGAPSTLVTLTATSIGGSGFFDPGPNLAPPALPFTHIGAAITNGVVVNSVTYISPTSVLLDLNTAAATGGSASITIINPDGQAMTGAGILTIAPSVVLAAPANVVAVATSTSTVKISWSSTAGAASYDVFRTDHIANPFTFAGNTSATMFVDGGLHSNTTYLYQVRALTGASVAGPFSTTDLATTKIFSDDPLATNSIVRAAHITELRTAVNAVRAAAALPAFSFTDPLPSGLAILSAHVIQLRSALDAARLIIGVPPMSYANSAAAGTFVRSVDIDEIRNGTR